jgi:hypothetical protein
VNVRTQSIFFIFISRRLSLFDFATQTSTTMVSSNLIDWNLSLVVIAGVVILAGGGGEMRRGRGLYAYESRLNT